jgi:DNA-binding MarR family transcriptional regulator
MKRDLEPLSNERLAHLVKNVFRLTSEMLQKRLKSHGVLYSHWTLLRVLWVGDGLTQRQLSDLAGISEPSTFMALKAMEKKGYVLRQKMPDNKKQIRVFLTPMGLQLKQVMVPEAENINAQALWGLTPQDIHVTRRTLLAMVDNLKQGPLNPTAASPVHDAHDAQDAQDAWVLELKHRT